MPPASSLVFVVIIAIWGAYLMSHWVRRREHLAMARSVDRYSRAMRVLERTGPVAQGTMQRRTVREVLRPVGTGAAVAGVATARTVAAGAGAVRRTRMTRRARGRLVLSMLVVVLVTAVLAPFTPVPWWVPAVAFVGLAGVLVLLGRLAAAERAARGGRTVRPAVRRERVALRHTAEARSAEDAPVMVSTEAEVKPVREQLFDLAALEEQIADARRAAGPVVASQPWSPTPVPKPTYTMKAPARRRVEDVPFSAAAMSQLEELEELTPVYEVG